MVDHKSLTWVAKWYRDFYFQSIANIPFSKERKYLWPSQTLWSPIYISEIEVASTVNSSVRILRHNINYIVFSCFVCLCWSSILRLSISTPPYLSEQSSKVGIAPKMMRTPKFAAQKKQLISILRDERYFY